MGSAALNGFFKRGSCSYPTVLKVMNIHASRMMKYDVTDLYRWLLKAGIILYLLRTGCGSQKTTICS